MKLSNTNQYNKAYAKITLTLMLAELDDLNHWSTYNQDKALHEINEIEKLIKKIQKIL